MAKKKASVNRNICVACGVCYNQCPRKAISIYKGCYATVDLEKCVGCGICANACPANVISILEVDQEVANG